jgi:hypothetical protein
VLQIISVKGKQTTWKLARIRNADRPVVRESVNATRIDLD